MSHPQTLPVVNMSREDMLKRVARFKDLRGHDGGLPDSNVPGSYRTLINVVGFQPPEENAAAGSPVGANAARDAAIPIREGFNLGYCRCKPGNGPLMHNHDTNETFIPMTGKWRCSWNEGETESVDVGPMDVVSFPPGVVRRFENITFDEADQEHILMFVISGNAPTAEFTPEALEIAREKSEKAETA